MLKPPVNRDVCIYNVKRTQRRCVDHFTYIPTSKCTKEHTVLVRVCIIQSLHNKSSFYNTISNRDRSIRLETLPFPTSFNSPRIPTCQMRLIARIQLSSETVGISVLINCSEQLRSLIGQLCRHFSAKRNYRILKRQIDTSYGSTHEFLG